MLGTLLKTLVTSNHFGKERSLVSRFSRKPEAGLLTLILLKKCFSRLPWAVHVAVPSRSKQRADTLRLPLFFLSEDRSTPTSFYLLNRVWLSRHILTNPLQIDCQCSHVPYPFFPFKDSKKSKPENQRQVPCPTNWFVSIFQPNPHPFERGSKRTLSKIGLPSVFFFRRQSYP
jgi:hypothetical protein